MALVTRVDGPEGDVWRVDAVALLHGGTVPNTRDFWTEDDAP